MYLILPLETLFIVIEYAPMLNIWQLEATLATKEEALAVKDNFVAENIKILADKERALAEKDSAKDAVQSELDDLLMVFGDLEDKVSKYKVWIRFPVQEDSNWKFRNDLSP